MTNNLPERHEASIAIPGVQPALFEDSTLLLAKDPAELRRIGMELAHVVAPRYAEIRRMVGLVCWAMRTKVPPGEYGTWVEGYAELVGVTARTLGEWRQKAEKAAGAVSPYQSPRQTKTAGQRTQLEETSKTAAVIPASSTEAPASAPPEPREAVSNGSGRVVQSPTPIAQPWPAERPITDDEGLRWLTSKTDAQVRALADPFGSAIRSQVARWAGAFGYDRPTTTAARRHGTVTRPADRALVPATNGGACPHPKAHERNTGYAILCGDCGVRLR